MNVGFIFIPIWLIFMGYIFYSLLTRKGRNLQIKNRYKADVIRDLGIISAGTTNQRGFSVNQKLHLLKCQSQTETFFLLEVTDTTLLSLQMNWIKLSKETLNTLFTLTKKVN